MLQHEATNGNLDKGSLEIYSLEGARLVSIDVPAIPSLKVDVGTLPDGVYLLRYESGKSAFTQKLFIVN